MFGVSHQWCGRASLIGIRPLTSKCQRCLQKAKLGSETIARRPIRGELFERGLGRAHRLEGLAEHDVVERAVGIIDQVGLGVALDDRQAGADAGIDAIAAELDATAVDALEADQVVEQDAVAAADVEHPRSRLDQVGDDLKVGADRAPRGLSSCPSARNPQAIHEPEFTRTAATAGRGAARRQRGNRAIPGGTRAHRREKRHGRRWRRSRRS